MAPYNCQVSLASPFQLAESQHVSLFFRRTEIIVAGQPVSRSLDGFQILLALAQKNYVIWAAIREANHSASRPSDEEPLKSLQKSAQILEGIKERVSSARLDAIVN